MKSSLYSSDSTTFESPSKNFIVWGQKVKKISFCSRKVMETLNKDMMLSQDEISNFSFITLHRSNENGETDRSYSWRTQSKERTN